MISRKQPIRRWIALGAAIAAVAAVLVPAAPAKPTPAKPQQPSIESPYLIPPARAGDEPAITLGPGEVPYFEHAGVPQATEARAADGGYDVGFGVASSAVILGLLAVGGSLYAIRQSRKAKLSPA